MDYFRGGEPEEVLVNFSTLMPYFLILLVVVDFQANLLVIRLEVHKDNVRMHETLMLRNLFIKAIGVSFNVKLFSELCVKVNQTVIKEQIRNIGTSKRVREN